MLSSLFAAKGISQKVSSKQKYDLQLKYFNGGKIFAASREEVEIMGDISFCFTKLSCQVVLLRPLEGQGLLCTYA